MLIERFRKKQVRSKQIKKRQKESREPTPVHIASLDIHGNARNFVDCLFKRFRRVFNLISRFSSSSTGVFCSQVKVTANYIFQKMFYSFNILIYEINFLGAIKVAGSTSQLNTVRDSIVNTE